MSYTYTVLESGMLDLEFKDAGTKAGFCVVGSTFSYPFVLRGQRIIASGSIECLTISFQPSLAKQMVWGQFISYEGTGRTNATADLHIEQLNKEF